MTETPLMRPSLLDLPIYAPSATACPIDLRDNTNLWGAPPNACAAVRQVSEAALTQYPAVAAGTLVAHVASFVGVQPSEVAAGCGSDDLIDAAFRAAAEPGARVAHPAPSFSMVPIFARLNGLEPVAVPLRSDGSADADAMLATGARIIYLCSPNNPTGTVTTINVVRRLVRESDAVIVLDGAYAEFAPNCDDVLAEAPALGRLLVLRTFSKAWGLAGLRVGYAVGSTTLIKAVQRSLGPYKVSATAELAAVAALTKDVDWMRQCAAEAIAVRERVVDELRRLGFAPLPSHGNFIALPVADANAVSSALALRGVAVRAFVALPVYGDMVRIGVAPWPVMEQVLAALREVLA